MLADGELLPAVSWGMPGMLLSSGVEWRIWGEVTPSGQGAVVFQMKGHQGLKRGNHSKVRRQDMGPADPEEVEWSGQNVGTKE